MNLLGPGVRKSIVGSEAKCCASVEVQRLITNGRRDVLFAGAQLYILFSQAPSSGDCLALGPRKKVYCNRTHFDVQQALRKRCTASASLSFIEGALHGRQACGLQDARCDSFDRFCGSAAFA